VRLGAEDLEPRRAPIVGADREQVTVHTILFFLLFFSFWDIFFCLGFKRTNLLDFCSAHMVTSLYL
jgi:hypothetical protein